MNESNSSHLKPGSSLRLELRQPLSLLALAVVLLLPLSSMAGLLCRSLFSDSPSLTTASSAKTPDWSQPPEYAPYRSGLNVAALAKFGFELNNNGKLTKSDKQEVVGYVRTLRSRYLFQWADKEYQKELIKEGVHNDWMAEILQAPPQVAGKGFYVSINPLDSSAYGSNLTMFEVTKPVQVLEIDVGFSVRNLLSQNSRKNTELTKAWAELGIDAIRTRTYKETWLSVISNRHLKRATQEIPEDLLYITFYNFGPRNRSDFLNWGQYHRNLLDLLYENDRTFPIQAARNMQNTRVSNEDLQKIFLSKSANAKYFALAQISTGASTLDSNFKAPSQMLTFLQKGAKKNSRPEIQALWTIWSKLTPAQRKLFPKTTHFEYLVRSYKLKSQSQSKSDFDFLLDQSDAKQMEELLEDVRSNFSGHQFNEMTEQIYRRLPQKVVTAENSGDMLSYLNLIDAIDPTRFAELNFRGSLAISPKDSHKEQLNDALIELYDLKTIVYSNDGKLRTKISMEEMKRDAKRYLQLSSQTDLSKIRTLPQFLELGRKLFGITYKFRDYGVVMTPEDPQLSYRMNMNSRTFTRLQDNPFLKLSDVNKLTPDSYQAMVEYWNPRLTRDSNSTMLSPELSALSSKLLKRPEISDENADFRALTQNSLKEVTEKIMSGDLKVKISKTPYAQTEFESPEHLYKVFVSLHPFEDGNGRMGRLLYQILKAREGDKKASLDMPVYDWDLMIKDSDIAAYQNIGAVLKAWVRKAPTDDELVLRSRWALYFLGEVFPQFRSLN